MLFAGGGYGADGYGGGYSDGWNEGGGAAGGYGGWQQGGQGPAAGGWNQGYGDAGYGQGQCHPLVFVNSNTAILVTPIRLII